MPGQNERVEIGLDAVLPFFRFLHLVREIVQNWGDVDGSLGDSIFDGAMWCFGALMALAGMWWWSRRL